MITTVNKISNTEGTRVVTWFLALYFFLAPLDFFSIILDVSTLRLLAFLPMLGLLFYIRSMKIYSDRYFFLPIVYTAFLVLTSIYSVGISASQERIISTATNIAMILFLSMLDYNWNEVQILRKAIVYSGWVATVLLLYASRDFTIERLTITLAGQTEDHNMLVGSFIFIFIHYLDQYLRQKKIRYLVYIAVFLILVFLTGSRGGLLAILGAALFFMILWLYEKKLKFSVSLKVLLLTCMLALTIYLIFDRLPDELKVRFMPSIEVIEEGGSSRIKIWTSVIESFTDASFASQLFGMGAATVSFFSYDGLVGHNIWIDSLIETGIIGTVILFVFYFTYLKKACNLKEHVVSSAFFGYMLLALTISLYRYRPIWNILLFILILKNFEARKSDSSITPIINQNNHD